MELKKWTYDEYPEYVNDHIDVIPSTGDEVGVCYFDNVVYAQMPEADLHLQILVPFSRNDQTGLRPCVVYVQGSAWKKQHLYMGIPDLSRLAARGYVVAVVEYRHSGIASFPAPVIDARNAVRFLRKNAAQYRIDPERMIMSGSSSGGHTAVYAGFTHNDGSKDDLYPGYSAETSGIIDYYGSTSFMFEYSNPSTPEHLTPESPEGMEAGHIDLRENEEMRRKMSVECNITAATVIPPTLILHGTKDRTVHPECSVRLYEQMKKTHHDVQMYLVRGADHGGAEFWSDAVLDTVDAFIRKCFEK
ncbi:MAG: alpha/beta hydrolase [Solobacterium sp.]|nr:alpha/beta hydrolase [Solobacterium sp.]